MEDKTVTVIAADGWWAIHADMTAETERAWFVSRVAGWIVDAGRRRHDGEPIATATPLLGGIGDGYLSDCGGVIALVHEDEMTPELRAALPWLTPEQIEREARSHVDFERRHRERQAAKAGQSGAQTGPSCKEKGGCG